MQYKTIPILALKVGSHFKFVANDFSTYETVEITPLNDSNECIFIFKNTMGGLISHKIYTKNNTVCIAFEPIKENAILKAERERMQYLNFLRNQLKTNK